MSSLGELHKKGISLLKELDKPALEAKVILLKAAGVSEERFFSEPNFQVSEEIKNEYFRMLEKRVKGKPLAYITGEKEFWSMDFKVGEGVLIPRPETEILVEKVLELYSGSKGIIVDMGTGCGNIALSLARELPGSKILGLDISDRAVYYAQKNAFLHHIQNVWFIVGDMFGALKKNVLRKKCELIVSNPPYVAQREWSSLEPQIRDHEPKEALVSGRDGTEFINQLVRKASEYLKPKGYLLFEIGKGQENKVKSFFSKKWERVEIIKDLAGIKRIFLAKLED
jgi:release factor glutamine methyltransferase